MKKEVESCGYCGRCKICLVKKMKRVRVYPKDFNVLIKYAKKRFVRNDNGVTTFAVALEYLLKEIDLK